MITGYCSGCIFWINKHCHRHAPSAMETTAEIPYDTSSARPVWPRTDADDTCGDFELDSQKLNAAFAANQE